jgi:RimJ/RimL family protein N-acetyltransferase
METDRNRIGMIAAALPAFPRGTAVVRLAQCRLRPAGAADIEPLRALYAQWCMSDGALLPWPETERVRIAEGQFALQHRQFVERFPEANFWVIEDREEQSIGRLYLDRSSPAWSLIDLLLAPAARGLGHGTQLLRWMQAEAGATGAAIHLHVATSNAAAQRLYARLGFRCLGERAEAVHLAMRWSPEAQR